MKKIKLSTILTITIFLMSSIYFTSCHDEAGVTVKKLNGDEENLPKELKGLKVYLVSTGDNGYIKVAVMNGEVNSTTYTEGKIQTSTVLINNKNVRTIEIKQIMLENDSMIVCRK